MVVSIIIPHYNSAFLLRKLLLSIGRYDEVEIVVVDDRSDDGQESYAELCRDAAFSHVSFFRNDYGRKGAGTCRNIGLEHATGEWVLFADADDYFVSAWFEKVVPYFKSTYDVVFFKPTSIYIDTGETAHRHERFCHRLERYIREPSPLHELELRYRIEVPWSKMIRRAFLDQHQIKFEEVLASNDVLFSARVGFYMETFAVSSETIYSVTRNYKTLTTNMSEAVFDIRLHEKIKYFRFLQERLESDALKTLNIAFLDLLIKSAKFGLFKFYKVFKTIRHYQLPLIDKRLFRINALTSLIARAVKKAYKEGGYTHVEY